MEQMYYLLNMGISGVKNLEKEIRLDFYKKTVDKNFDPDKYRIKAIYGENGSGKSAIITAMNIVKGIITNSRYLSDSYNQHFLHEIINKKNRCMHFDCEVLVDLDDQYVYKYSLDIGLNEDDVYEITDEKLMCKNGNYAKSRYRDIFETHDGGLVYVDCMEKNLPLINKISFNLLSSQSFITNYVMNQKKHHLIIEEDLPLHILTMVVFAVTITIYLDEEDQHELYFLQKSIKELSVKEGAVGAELENLYKRLNRFTSVNSKKIDRKLFDAYKESVEKLCKFIQIFKRDLISIDINVKEDGEYYECSLDMNYGEFIVNKEFESTGIKKLIRLFDCFSAVGLGGIVFIDELDSNMNDVYLCKLLEYFMYYTTGQLCFTTHNLDPMSLLKENKGAINFLSSDNIIVPWVSRGNASPENCYKNGMIEQSPFNIDATDFIGILGE